MKVVYIIDLFLCLFFSQISYSYNNSVVKNFIDKRRPTNWCIFTCGWDNIVCEKNSDCTPDINPWGKCEFVAGIKGRWADKIVNFHNDMRQRFASGQEKAANNIQVANMMAIRWDKDLAFAAECNLEDCHAETAHDKCRTTPKFPQYVSQSIWNYRLAPLEDHCHLQISKAMNEWYNEIKKSNVDRILTDSKSFLINSDTKHFTQMIWAETTHIGCTLRQIRKSFTQCALVCNFGPGGNVYEKSMLIIGPPCSQCPTGSKCNDDKNALCEQIEEKVEEEEEEEEEGKEKESETEAVGAAKNLSIDINIRLCFVLLANNILGFKIVE